MLHETYITFTVKDLLNDALAVEQNINKYRQSLIVIHNKTYNDFITKNCINRFFTFNKPEHIDQYIGKTRKTYRQWYMTYGKDCLDLAILLRKLPPEKQINITISNFNLFKSWAKHTSI